MEWIKVIDKIPEEEGEIIIYFKNKAGWHVGTCVWEDDDFIDLCYECGHKASYRYSTLITHWMKLPKKPEE